MNEHGKSDSLIVPGKPVNKGSGAPGSAEPVEGRGLAEGNPTRRPRSRTQSREILQQATRRIRQAAKGRKKERFTALWHHVYDPARLKEAYWKLKRKSAPGIDGATWKQYGKELARRIGGLTDRLRRGAYQPPPVIRAYISKPDGRQRPIGMPTVEDKIAQRAFTEVVGAVYEADFKGFSYAFRPGRSPHDALDALTVGLQRKKVNWVLDADIRGFFDAIDHEWLLKFLQHRIADKRVLRQVRRWLRAGVMEEGGRTVTEAGTPQGGSASPLLANIYLHYVFDLWVDQWRRRHARGDVIIVRFADDFVVGFQYRGEAERFLYELRQRLAKFHLELHADKTRLIRFGRFAALNRAERGEGKPETFNFLGFTHICDTDRKGRFVVLRRTMRSRKEVKLRQMKIELRRRLHDSVPETGRWLASVLRGHYNYYGVPRNYEALAAFYNRVLCLWHRTLRRRSDKHTMTWKRMSRLAQRWLPPPRITHPYPAQRLRVTT